MKRRFCEFLVKNKWVFIAIFALLTIVSCVLIFFTDIVYDLSTYLPADSDANIGVEVLKAEFGDKGMAYAVVEDISKTEAESLSHRLAEIDGVNTVVYVEMQNYIDGNAMYTVSFDDYDSTPECFATMKRVINFIDNEGYQAYFSGQSASSYYTKLETESSILKLGVVIVVIILAMLIFTSKSYFEIFPMIITFGVAVALNMGTNFFFNFTGGISYVSNLVSLVLQLALSIDYSVILVHRLMEEKNNFADNSEAIVVAMEKGITEICSSSLTTIAGLLSLVFMSLSIGREIGIALAKGIVFSLISVIFLMPALLTVFGKQLKKTVHKPFVPNVERFFAKTYKARFIIVPIFIVIVVVAGVGQSFNNFSFNMNGGANIVNDNKKIEECGFGKMNTFVVVVPKGDYAKERELAEYIMGFEAVDGCNALASIEIAEGLYLTDEFSEEELKEYVKNSELGEFKGMEGVINLFLSDCFSKALTAKYPENSYDKISLLDLLVFVYNDDEYNKILDSVGSYKDMIGQLIYAKGNLEGENYSRLTFNICTGIESEKTFDFIKNVKCGIKEYYDVFYITGESVVCFDMANYFPKDNLIVSLVTVLAILTILLFTFKNFLLPIILILVIQGGIWINFVIPVVGGTMLSIIGYLIISAIQMGATIDYAIVLTNRFNINKVNFSDHKQGMAKAENLVFPTIITSGVILTLTGAAMAILSSGVVASMGSLLAIGTACSMLIVLFVLPSMLLLSEKMYDKCYFKNIFKNKKKKFSSDVASETVSTKSAENKE